MVLLREVNIRSGQSAGGTQLTNAQTTTGSASTGQAGSWTGGGFVFTDTCEGSKIKSFISVSALAQGYIFSGSWYNVDPGTYYVIYPALITHTQVQTTGSVSTTLPFSESKDYSEITTGSAGLLSSVIAFGGYLSAPTGSTVSPSVNYALQLLIKD